MRGCDRCLNEPLDDDGIQVEHIDQLYEEFMTLILSRQQLLPLATAIAATLTLLVVRTPAKAATVTYDYTGTVTSVVAGGMQIPNGSSALDIGDPISGSYSYDDAVLIPDNPSFSALTEFSLNTPAFDQTLNNFLGIPVNGIIDLTTGNIAVGVNSPVFLPGGFSAEQGSFLFIQRQVSTIGTFQPVKATPSEPVPEPSASGALLVIGVVGLLLRRRGYHRAARTSHPLLGAKRS